MPLKNRQLEVLDFIKQFIATKGYSPTVREIGAGVGLKSPSSVQDNLKKLALQGYLTIDNKKSRTIELLVQNEYLNTEEDIVSIPILDDTSDEAYREFIKIPIFLLSDYDSKNIYAYRTTNCIYIVNTSLKFSDRKSLVKKDNKYIVQELPKDEIVGNIISEFRKY